MKKVWLPWALVGPDKSTRDMNGVLWAGPTTAKGSEGREPLVVGLKQSRWAEVLKAARLSPFSRALAKSMQGAQQQA